MKILFCGVGALGSTAALFCRNIKAELRFVDFDRVESKNILAQNFVKQSIGKNKAEALKLQFQNFYGLKTEAYGVKLQEENISMLCDPVDLVVDCFDNQKSRLLLSTYARKSGKPLIHAALAQDGTFGMVRWDEHFVPDAEEQDGQATCEGGEHLPFIGVLSSTLARVIQEYVRSQKKQDALVSLTHVSSVF